MSDGGSSVRISNRSLIATPTIATPAGEAMAGIMPRRVSAGKQTVVCRLRQGLANERERRVALVDGLDLRDPEAEAPASVRAADERVAVAPEDPQDRLVSLVTQHREVRGGARGIALDLDQRLDHEVLVPALWRPREVRREVGEGLATSDDARHIALHPSSRVERRVVRPEIQIPLLVAIVDRMAVGMEHCEDRALVLEHL